MTGRRLYDHLTDALAGKSEWTREQSHLLPVTPVAWAFLTGADRDVLNAVAKRIPKRGRA